MAFKATATWLTVCLHYNEPWEVFLAKAVKPYVDVVMQTGVAENWFFLRCWERGPHIRLYFKGNPFVLENMLKPNLKEHFLTYFESRPSFLIEPVYPPGYPAAARWLPNNSVHFPDTEKTDLPAELIDWKWCEKQFEASSNLVLKHLKDQSARWTQNEMMSVAIKLNLSQLYAMGLTQQETARFLQALFEIWRKKSLDTEATANNQKANASVLTSFQKIFDLQKKDIVPYQTALWELFKNYQRLDDGLFIDWFHINASTGLDLSLAIEQGRLPFHNLLSISNLPGGREQETLWSYFAEMVFQTNNRLGIHHKNEGYLFYAMERGMELSFGIRNPAREEVLAG
jgi:hypothetical protein